MTIRDVGVLLALTSLASCAEPVSGNHRVLSAQDPPLYGQAGLITPTELHAALVPAHERLAKLAPVSSIFRVTVLTRYRLEVYYTFNSDKMTGFFPQNHPNTGFLLLEFRNGVWEVRPGTNTEVIMDPNIIVTEIPCDLTRRCS